MNEKVKNRKRKMLPSKSEEPVLKHHTFNEISQIEEDALSKDLFGNSVEFRDILEDSSDSVEGFGEIEQENKINEEPVWHDEDDDINVNSALKTQGRNLVDGGNNDKSSKYSNHLKHKFITSNKTPEWANLTTALPKDDDEELVRTSGFLVKSDRGLSSDTLEIKRVYDLNAETLNEGPLITAVEFHPSSTVALVAGISGIISLFAVDGKRNSKLHSIAFDNCPIECARFLHNGTEVLLGSRHSHFFTYDLITAKTVSASLPHGMTQCKKFEVSPCNKIVAVAGKWGQIHLLSANTKELITTLKQNSDVTDIAFHPNGSSIIGHSSVGEVTVWDVVNQRVKHRWNDEGSLQGTTIEMSPCGKLIATGSAQGVVNVYDIETVLTQQNPKPRKSILNLTTPITTLRFNGTSEILGFASSEVYNAVRLLNVSSGKVFSNFPQWGTKLGRVNCLSFSPNSGYGAFANRNSTVSLYRLKHFNNY